MALSFFTRQQRENSSELVDLLDPSLGQLELPIRAEIFGASRLEQHAKSLAQAQKEGIASRPTGTPFYPRLKQNVRVIRQSHAYISEQERTGHHISQAGEWLLDNFQMLMAQLDDIELGLPRRYFSELPVLTGPHLSGLPRIYGVAWAFVAHTDSAIDTDLLVRFLNAYQTVDELTFGEIWASSLTLRVLLVENLRRLSERVATAKASRMAADRWCDALFASSAHDAKSLEARYNDMASRGVGRAFILQVSERLRVDTTELADSAEALAEGVLKSLRETLARLLPDPSEAQVQQNAEKAADNLSMRNAITSLRLLEDADWREVVNKTSILVHALQSSSTFCAEREDTQDGSLFAIQRIARRSKLAESVIAAQLLALMGDGLSGASDREVEYETVSNPASLAGKNAATKAPGYWLRGVGRTALYRALGVREQRNWAARQVLRKSVLPLYVFVLLAGSVAGAAWLLLGHEFSAPMSGGFVLLGLGMLAILPAGEAVIAVVHRMLSESLSPRQLPRLALTAGIGATQRVLVVIPAMLTSKKSVTELALQLEQHYLANAEACAQFALLTDFADADAAVQPVDSALLAQAQEALGVLEARYAHAELHGARRRFLLLHRERTWSQTERRFIGWERKRGKLEALVHLLADGGESPFIDFGDLSTPAPATPYVVTLDSDTGLPPGTLRALVGVASHPLNQPLFDSDQRRVVSGYGILQPRLSTPLPEPGKSTLFHWLFSGRCGIDPYSAATSEIYQDLFSEGSFVGKGLLNVRAMHLALGGRLPEGQVLSHDLLEGSLARCASVSDITLMEDAPVHSDVAAARIHRWTRGDWQLLPVMLQWRRFALPGIARWKLVDNLRRSLVAPASVVLLVLALAGGPLSPWRTLVAILLAFGAGPLIGALAGLAPARDNVAGIYFYRQAFKEVLRAFGSALWNLVTLLQQSMLLLNAILSALWRTFVSRRGLLQWTTAASAQAAAQTRLTALALAHAPVSVVAALIWIGLWSAGTTSPVVAAVLCAAWAAAPVWTWLASRAWRFQERPHPADSDQEYLLGVARDTWRYFERHVNAQTHYLPPDNVQIVPTTMVAERTSPTNIGLYLLAVACARTFGWIDTAQLLARCEDTLRTMDQLERYRGHFLNWYDTRSLGVLSPSYVSAVDSGNLCGHLLALAGACDELIEESGVLQAGQADRLADVSARCHRFAIEAEFGFLYHPRKRLLHLGYRIADAALDNSFYDLLASEARLASLWAIAKGDVPPEHWGALGRPFYGVGKRAALRSWSGSMFEYLMPSLVLEEPAGSALDSAARSAIYEQQEYGKRHDVPWGVSESAYAAGDHTLAYQYAPQGVPRLALRRTPAGELVVAPYATALAAMFQPETVSVNLRLLESLHARGDMGFFEALDFSPERQNAGSRYQVVSTFMAHHQGMALVAITNLLQGAAPRRWTMADARLRAVSGLLQEAVPREIPRLVEPLMQPRRAVRAPVNTFERRDVVPGATALQPTLLLSNGRYSVSLRANGAGWSRFGTADISRWRDDALRDSYGSFVYLRRVKQDADADAESGLVSITQHPAADPQAAYRMSLHGDHACFHAQWTDLRSCCTVWVSPEDDIELRRVELWNPTNEPIELELFSVFEVSLVEARADQAHPAFANLFVRAEWVGSDQALYFARRPHTPAQKSKHAVHFVAQSDKPLREVRVQTDRAAWLGRNRDASDPLALCDVAPEGTSVLRTGLDPVSVIGLKVVVPAQSRTQFTLGTAAADSREALDTLVDRYRQSAALDRSMLMSATFASVRMREMGILREDRAAIQMLSTLLVMLHAKPGPRAVSNQNSGDRRTLWRFGISGDRPMLLVEISAGHGVRLVSAMVRALRLWAWGGLPCDLVVVNAEPPSYQMPLQLELQELQESYKAQSASTDPSRACGLHLLRQPELSDVEQTTLRMLARARLVADGRPLAQHLRELAQWHDTALDARIDQHNASPAPKRAGVAVAEPKGTFESESGAFAFDVTADKQLSRPWVNVIANPDFGTQVSEAGAGYTWAGNSQQHQLTVWSNDPVSDPGGEVFWLQDLETRTLFGIGKGFEGVRSISHGQGTTVIRQRHGAIEIVTTWCVDPVRSVKQVQISAHNHGDRPLQLRAIGLLEWVMGSQRLDRQSVATACEPADANAQTQGPILLAIQRDAQSGFGGSTAFFALRAPSLRSSTAEAHGDWTCDRREFFDARGHCIVPDHLGAHSGLGSDPCAALGCLLNVAPGATEECVFLLGHGANREEALTLARKCLSGADEEGMSACQAAVREKWQSLLMPVQVRTPDPLFDALVNHWLLYQTLSCRMWARAGFYQAGGAFGFRDQLQDSMALAIGAPQLLRKQLLLSASRQFVEGDVQHWWHPPAGAGVRTHCSDDMLWLPEAVARYVQITGDDAVLDEEVSFLEGPPIPEGEHDAYFVPTISQTQASLYEHCARAVDCSLAVGEHGLPLIGTGDWNDGMNLVGDKGRGESVWLAWFLCSVTDALLPIAKMRGDSLRVQSWTAAADGWRDALAGPAWDGEWFKRAFFDDGTPLGTSTAEECRIDLIAQSWSVLSGVATPDRQKAAMDSVARLLVDEEAGLNRLLTPPLQNMEPSAGYIQAYPPGVRENGGQYSHAGVWKLMAQARMGDGDGAFRTFTQLSPAHRNAHPEQSKAYGLEPYVMAGDIYTERPYVGRGGWSWYTGSAAWMHRAAVESILGLQVQGDQVRLEPCLPGHWPQAQLTLSREAATHRFTVLFDDAFVAIADAKRAGIQMLEAGAWATLPANGESGDYLVTVKRQKPAPAA